MNFTLLSTMWPILFSLALQSDQIASQIAADEVVVFYPTYAHRTTDEKSWVVHIHGRIFEPEEDSRKRALLLGIVRRSFRLSKEEEQTATFRDRLHTFLVDNERNKTIHIRLGDHVYRAGNSAANGHFASDLVLSNEEVEALRAAGPAAERRWLQFTAVVPADDSRRFAGEVELIEPRGLSIVSDVDDTIKLSQVNDRRALMANTFLRPFKPVEGMAAAYREWESQGARFHYVSATPWQLYGPMAEFLKAERFPAGTFHMKVFRLKDSSALSILGTQHRYKPEVVARILTDFPQRRFVLVGDSGEQDPEIYADLARKYPEQVARVFIRESRPTEDAAGRYDKAFKDIHRDRWQVFTKPTDLPLQLPYEPAPLSP